MVCKPDEIDYVLGIARGNFRDTFILEHINFMGSDILGMPYTFMKQYFLDWDRRNAYRIIAGLKCNFVKYINRKIGKSKILDVKSLVERFVTDGMGKYALSLDFNSMSADVDIYSLTGHRQLQLFGVRDTLEAIEVIII